MGYDVLKNTVVDHSWRSGETELAEDLFANSPRLVRKNLMAQPRVCGVDGKWTLTSITATQVAGYDGETEAWDMTGTKTEQGITVIPEAMTLSVYLAEEDPGLPKIGVEDPGGNHKYVVVDTSDGTVNSSVNQGLGGSISIDDSVSGWYRLVFDFTPLSAGTLTIYAEPAAGGTILDAFQLEKGTTATAFEEVELAPYGEVLQRTLVCDRCGVPARVCGDLTKNSKGFDICSDCWETGD